MRVLLDTNIVIHREASRVVREDIGKVFRWLDRLHCEKVVHPSTIIEIERHADPEVVRAFKAKITSYAVLKTIAPDTPPIAGLRAADKTPNDAVDTSLISELASNRVDLILTEDRGLHRKAASIGLGLQVFTLDQFLEKVTAENPELSDYTVLSVHRKHFGEIDVSDPFFDSFRRDYAEFNKWFARKSDEHAYVCLSEKNAVVAFLYLKREQRGSEDYSDIEPAFPRKDRLKIGTLKVASNGVKLGERFLKIVFDQALRFRVEEIYATLYRRSEAHDRLAGQLQEWGFVQYGHKRSASGHEEVFVRDFSPRADVANPRLTFPYVSSSSRKFIAAIYPQYHTELLPDSILKTERRERFVDDKPHRNALSKVFISRSFERGLRSGDAVVFYRTKDAGPAFYTSVATTIGIVEDVIGQIRSLQEFIAHCRKRSIFSDEDLEKHWNHNPRARPFVLNFLYAYSLPRRPNLKALIENGVIEAAPRGIDQISNENFMTLMRLGNADTRFIVD